jgi:dolichyl-phosphate beta-glucosyltransferase
MERKSISVVVPCFNEGKTINRNLKKINQFLAENFSDYEIIAVNDGSRDNTSQELARTAEEISRLIVIDNKTNKGKGGVVREGMLKGQCEIMMFMDADLAMPIEDVGKFIREIESGYDLAIASRFVPGLQIKMPVLWYRKIMENIFRIIRMVVINNYSVKDTQCGFKVFSRASAKDIFPRALLNRFAFDAEIIFIAGKHGYKIKELPIVLQNPATSSIRVVRDSANMLCDLVRIRIHYFSGKYKRK